MTQMAVIQSSPDQKQAPLIEKTGLVEFASGTF